MYGTDLGRRPWADPLVRPRPRPFRYVRTVDEHNFLAPGRIMALDTERGVEDANPGYPESEGAAPEVYIGLLGISVPDSQSHR